MDFNTITDEELINIYKKDNKVESEALKQIIERYTPIINNKANKYFAIGSEKNDIIQESWLKIWLFLAEDKIIIKSLNEFKLYIIEVINDVIIELNKTAKEF